MTFTVRKATASALATPVAAGVPPGAVQNARLSKHQYFCKSECETTNCNASGKCVPLRP